LSTDNVVVFLYSCSRRYFGVLVGRVD